MPALKGGSCLHSKFGANEPGRLVNEATGILREVSVREMSVRRNKEQKVGLMIKVHESCLLGCYGVIQALRL